MILAEKAIEGASMLPEGQRLPFEDSLLGGRGSMCTFFGEGAAQRGAPRAPGSTVSLGPAFRTDESLQCDMAWLHPSTHLRGGMDKRNVILDTVVTNRTGV